MIFNMPVNSFILYYVVFFTQVVIVVGLGLFWYIRDSKSQQSGE